MRLDLPENKRRIKGSAAAPDYLAYGSTGSPGSRKHGLGTTDVTFYLTLSITTHLLFTVEPFALVSLSRIYIRIHFAFMQI